MSDEPPRYRCPHCGAVSFNLNDIAQGYCGRCHRWSDFDPRSMEEWLAVLKLEAVLAPFTREDRRRVIEQALAKLAERPASRKA